MQVPRIVNYTSKLLPALRQHKPLSKTITTHLCNAAIYPVACYAHIIWGTAANRRKTHQIINRAIRAVQLTIARCPPSTANHLLPKLTQLQSLANTVNQQATTLLVKHPHLFQTFIAPWLRDLRGTDNIAKVINCATTSTHCCHPFIHNLNTSTK